MSIVSKIYDIADKVAGETVTRQGNNIVAAIDALNDALAGSDQPAASSVTEALTLLKENAGSGSSNYGRLVSLGVYDTTQSTGVSFNCNVQVAGHEVMRSAPVDVLYVASGVNVTVLIGSESELTVTSEIHYEDGDGMHTDTFTDFTSTYSADDEGQIIEFVMPEVFGTVFDNGSSIQFKYAS